IEEMEAAVGCWHAPPSFNLSRAGGRSRQATAALGGGPSPATGGHARQAAVAAGGGPAPTAGEHARQAAVVAQPRQQAGTVAARHGDGPALMAGGHGGCQAARVRGSGSAGGAARGGG
ncbi:unnamed protein product, partial [Urochloa humidicola]